MSLNKFQFVRLLVIKIDFDFIYELLEPVKHLILIA